MSPGDLPPSKPNCRITAPGKQAKTLTAGPLGAEPPSLYLHLLSHLFSYLIVFQKEILFLPVLLLLAKCHTARCFPGRTLGLLLLLWLIIDLAKAV